MFATSLQLLTTDRNLVLCVPACLDAARVKEKCFSLSFTTTRSCQAWRRASTGKSYRVSRGVRPPQGRVGGPWRRWRAVRVEIAQPQSRFGPDPRAKSPPPGKAPPCYESVMCASPAARANSVNHAIPISYAINVRASPGPHRHHAVHGRGTQAHPKPPC